VERAYLETLDTPERCALSTCRKKNPVGTVVTVVEDEDGDLFFCGNECWYRAFDDEGPDDGEVLPDHYSYGEA